ncbi:hypothetical protein GALMADRAFT_1294563 [Galerina marginata CBS 339.88]|uniref:Uncharacterized protein n=1 Tax=Galerina marginata (strain CBS 339.88) TaxID=685588 RepID=A0A067TG82_GALM3|nr:hypothetical protein GALMADRAFT_1294563 [Galerina marginata CBS 339.88]
MIISISSSRFGFYFLSISTRFLNLLLSTPIPGNQRPRIPIFALFYPLSHLPHYLLSSLSFSKQLTPFYSTDWARWALKGHKGFILTKEEVQNGITAQEYMRGLGRRADGVWVWGTEAALPVVTSTAVSSTSSSAAAPAAESTSTTTTTTTATPANNSIEVKREHLDNAGVNGAGTVPAGSTSSATGSVSIATAMPSQADKFAVITFPVDAPPQPESHARTPLNAAIMRPARSRSTPDTPAAASTGTGAVTAALKTVLKEKGKEKTNENEKEKDNTKKKDKEKAREKRKEERKKEKTKAEAPPSPVVGTKRPREEDGGKAGGDSISSAPEHKRAKYAPLQLVPTPISPPALGKSVVPNPYGRLAAGAEESISTGLKSHLSKQTARKSISLPARASRQRAAELTKKIQQADSDSDDSSSEDSVSNKALAPKFSRPSIASAIASAIRKKSDAPATVAASASAPAHALSASSSVATVATTSSTATVTSQKRKVSINGVNGAPTETSKEPETKKAKRVLDSSTSNQDLLLMRTPGASVHPFNAALSVLRGQRPTNPSVPAADMLRPSATSTPTSPLAPAPAAKEVSASVPALASIPGSVPGLSAPATNSERVARSPSGTDSAPPPASPTRLKPPFLDDQIRANSQRSAQAPNQSHVVDNSPSTPVSAPAPVPKPAGNKVTPANGASAPVHAPTEPVNMATNTSTLQTNWVALYYPLTDIIPAHEDATMTDVTSSMGTPKEKVQEIGKESVDGDKDKDRTATAASKPVISPVEVPSTAPAGGVLGEKCSKAKPMVPPTTNGTLVPAPVVAAPASSSSAPVSAAISRPTTTPEGTKTTPPPAPAPAPAPAPTTPASKSTPPPAPVISAPKPVTTPKPVLGALPRVTSSRSPPVSPNGSPRGNGKAMSTILSVLPLISGPVKVAAAAMSPTKAAVPILAHVVASEMPAVGKTRVEAEVAVDLNKKQTPEVGVRLEEKAAGSERAKALAEKDAKEKKVEVVGIPLVDGSAANVLPDVASAGADTVEISGSHMNGILDAHPLVVHEAALNTLQEVVVGPEPMPMDTGKSGAEADDNMAVDEPTEQPNLRADVGAPTDANTNPVAAANPTSPPAASTVLQSAEEHATSEQSVGLLMTQGTRAKSLHTILLLRDLLQFLRIPGLVGPGSPNGIAAAKGAPYILDTHAHYALLEGEEAMTIDQRLDILAHASVALAKVLFPFRGEELETRISSLDARLQQQFEMLWKPEERPYKDIQPHANISEEKEVQTSDLASLSFGVQTDEVEVPKPVYVEPRCLASQETQTFEQERRLGETGIQTERYQASQETQTVEQARPLGDAGVQTETDPRQTKTIEKERHVDSIGVQTEECYTSDTPPCSPGTLMRWAPQLSPEATMVDIMAPPPPPDSVANLDLSRFIPAITHRNNPAAKAMTSIMRNIADILEYASLNSVSSASLKGKERELSMTDVDLPPADSYVASPVVDAIVTEFRAMKDELRLSQHKHREGSEPMSALQRSEVETLKDELRSLEDRRKDEIEEMKRRHREEVQELRDSIRMMERDKDKKQATEEETRIPSLELLELRRRISSLEARSRMDSDIPGPTSQPSPAPTHYSESSFQRQTSLHPLGHLLTHDFDETISLSSPVPGRAFVRETSTPNPGTPISTGHSLSSRHPDGMEVDDMPLPIKSQRKLHMMMFPRPSIG